ncbi:acetyltransferase [Helicobacter enhydrae]|uniref:Acetyltransferase n=1 Tax=Helicobacter enhydrae TaxID=222136 RepID=A0A1B1U5H8_9HELI|nr:acetyltransferase [Helicobacter enhydrae]ANV98010.1 acetyltransferase [Helicobacter enhydrae]
MKPLILLGGGGHCKSCIDVIEQENRFRIIGILDANLFHQGIQKIFDYPILGGDEQLPNIRETIPYAFITIGQIKTPYTRLQVYHTLKKLDFSLPIIISPLAYVSKYSHIQEGSIIMHHALINANTSIGKMCIINSKSLIEHDCVIGDFCHISTGAILNGNCVLGEKTFVGSNTHIKHGKIIDSEQIIYHNLPF